MTINYVAVRGKQILIAALSLSLSLALSLSLSLASPLYVYNLYLCSLYIKMKLFCTPYEAVYMSTSIKSLIFNFAL
jgi:hypothetical protein